MRGNVLDSTLFRELFEWGPTIHDRRTPYKGGESSYMESVSVRANKIDKNDTEHPNSSKMI